MGLQERKEPSQRWAALSIAGQSSKDGLIGSVVMERLAESSGGHASHVLPHGSMHC